MVCVCVCEHLLLHLINILLKRDVASMATPGVAALGPWLGSGISTEPSTHRRKLYTANCTFITLCMCLCVYWCVCVCLYDSDFTDQQWDPSTPNAVAFICNWHTLSWPQVRRHQHHIRPPPLAGVMMFISKPQAPHKFNTVFIHCIVLHTPTC